MIESNSELAIGGRTVVTVAVGTDVLTAMLVPFFDVANILFARLLPTLSKLRHCPLRLLIFHLDDICALLFACEILG